MATTATTSLSHPLMQPCWGPAGCRYLLALRRLVPNQLAGAEAAASLPWPLQVARKLLPQTTIPEVPLHG
jgi:hypothetical protein